MDLEKTARNLLEFREEPHRVCAIVTWKGQVQGIALNSYVKTHPEQARLAAKVGHPAKQYLHAEVAALLRSQKGDAIHVFRLGKKGEWRNAKPCAICQLAISERKISKIFHT